jgi:hypothetical protein
MDQGFPAAMQAGQENVSELPNFRLRCPHLPHVLLVYASDPRRIWQKGGVFSHEKKINAIKSRQLDHCQSYIYRN